MGITAMDLFNDILTNENDLTNFLHQNDVKNVSASSPGIIIQGKIMRKFRNRFFCILLSVYWRKAYMRFWMKEIHFDRKNKYSDMPE